MARLILQKAGTERFLASAKTLKEAGWKTVYENAGGLLPDSGDDQNEEGEVWNFMEDGMAGGKLPDSQNLLKVREGDVFSDLAFTMTEGKTKAPAHFNEASLLSAMENPSGFLEPGNKEAAKTLGETGGLGTVATRADIIEKLFAGFLLEKKGRDILLTSKAKQLLELVPEDLKKPELTANWEKKLSEIAKGIRKSEQFMEEIREYSEALTDQIKTGAGAFRHDNMTNKKCPNCGKPLLWVKGKNSEMLVCQDRECKYRETLSRTSNARCPKCHKKMELKGSGDGQIFVCRCGYKEKLSAFKERRAREGAGVTKRDVANYLSRQNKEAAEPVNNAFAKALAGLEIHKN